MCKVMMLAGINSTTNAKAQRFIKVMAGLMSQYNKDGLGYAAVDGDGNMFGERWLENEKAFIRPSDIKVEEDPPQIAAMVAALGDSIKLDTVVAPPTVGDYGSFGNPDLSKLVAITMHTRMATSAKGFNNVHPFVNEEHDTSVIHNGVIRNDYKFTPKVSTCDSESILISYVNNGVGANPEAIQAVSSELLGYYACGVFSRDEQGNRILDYFKGNGAQLHASFIKELGTFVITTSSSDIKDACNKLGYTYGNIWCIAEGWLVRLNPFTGGLITKQQFKVGSEYYDNKSYWKPQHTGAKVYEPETLPPPPTNISKVKNISKEMMAYLKLRSSGHAFSLNERKEFFRNLKEA